jgi:2-hydroxychromene-2-carboxylate isomerase
MAELGLHGASLSASMAQKGVHAACVDVTRAVAEHGVHGFPSVLTVAGSGVHG